KVKNDIRPTASVIKSKKKSNLYFRFTIQVASFKDKKDADRLVKKLKKGKYQAYSSIGAIPSKGIWYRVRIGYFKTRADAAPILTRLTKEHRKAFLIHR
ncbi:MAG: SPOR domain-containing protein, partial [Desulfobacterales bacterium]